VGNARLFAVSLLPLQRCQDPGVFAVESFAFLSTLGLQVLYVPRQVRLDARRTSQYNAATFTGGRCWQWEC